MLAKCSFNVCNVNPSKCCVSQKAGLNPDDNPGRQLQMTMEEIRGRDGINLQPKRLTQISLKRQLQGGHERIRYSFHHPARP